MPGKQKTLAIGSDHAGFVLKKYLVERLESEGYNLFDFGTHSSDSVDYPDYAIPVCSAVREGLYTYGILICGTGNGMAMTANKVQGIRAALCWNIDTGIFARSHNNANVIALPARFLEAGLAFQIVNAFLETEFEGGRHVARLKKMDCVNFI